MTPSLDSLRCFVHAAKTLNFRSAAKQVSLTPAALGQRIRQLEELFEVQLFVRTTRSVSMTEAGMALVPYAKRALAAADDCYRAARGDLGPPAMEIVLGTRYELGLSWITPMLPKLRRHHGSTTFHLYFGSGADLARRVRYTEIDCAVTSLRITDPKIDSIRLHREDYVFVGHPDLLRERPFKRPEHAADHALVDVDGSLPLFHYWRDAPGGIDSLEFSEILRAGTIAAIRDLVRRGDGVAVLPLYFVDKDVRSGKLSKIMPKVKPLSDYFRLIFRADDPRRSHFESIAETMRSIPLR